MKDRAEIETLLNAMLNETLGEAEAARLEELLKGTDRKEARRLYFEYTDVQAAMVEGTVHAISDLDELDEVASQGGLQTAEGVDVAATYEGVVSGSAMARWAMAACVVAAGLMLAIAVRNKSDRDQATEMIVGAEVVAGDAGRTEAEIETLGSTEQKPPFVAEIVAVTPDARWATGSASREFLMRVRAGEELSLDSGLVKLEYFTGAVLVLKGPCRLTPTGEQSARLASGEISGEVTIGDFHLTTPTAKVIDLGTAFGVLASDSETEVHVLDGKVQIASGKTEGGGPAHSVMLSRGMAARANGRGIDVGVQFKGRRFATAVETSPSLVDTGRLSLVDVMNHDGDGGYRVATGIAPDSGDPYQQATLEAQSAFPRRRRGVYHVTKWHPMVDGVFIPNHRGTAVQCDSTGGEIVLPACGASTSGPIWSRRALSGPEELVRLNDNFWGGRTLKRVLRRLRQADFGMVGLHANVGITFDLKAIQRVYGRPATEFRTVIANLDNSDEYPSAPTEERRFTADFRLFVDQELRRSRISFGRTDGDMTIVQRLDPDDHFLTIVTSDAGHYWYDQVALIDPYLSLDLLPGGPSKP